MLCEAVKQMAAAAKRVSFIFVSSALEFVFVLFEIKKERDRLTQEGFDV